MSIQRSEPRIRPYRALPVILLAACSAPAVAPADLESQARQPAQIGEWGAYVRTCLDTLIEHGTDTYGEIHSPLLMAVLDVRTLQSPEKPELYDSLVRLEERLHRRGERGSNLWYDQKTLLALHRVGSLTGDAKYAAAADAYVGYAFDHCVKPSGLPIWGSHIYWDCYLDRAGGDQDGAGPHEPLVFEAAWEEMYRVRPEAVRAAIDGMWDWHVVDKETGLFNRHDDRRKGCDFAFFGSTMISAFACMHAVTGEQRYLDRARRIAAWHWQHRHPETGLFPDAPSTGGRYDSQHCFTNEPGLYARQLLRAYEQTGATELRAMAFAIIDSYDRYAWDAEARTFHAMLQLDGTPVPVQAKGSGYDAWAPYGHVEIWRTSIFSYEFALAAAQAAIYAYEVSQRMPEGGAERLLEIALHWSQAIEGHLPPRTGRRWRAELEASLPELSRTGGVYAEDYGRAISFFVHLARATGQERFLQQARTLAQEATEKLFENGLFRGHPAKPYYEATNGVGLLLWALLELDAPDENLRGAF